MDFLGAFYSGKRLEKTDFSLILSCIESLIDLRILLFGSELRVLNPGVCFFSSELLCLVVYRLKSEMPDFEPTSVSYGDLENYQGTKNEYIDSTSPTCFSQPI
jgi:hypothetical protein